jgi:hypothetical protein
MNEEVTIEHTAESDGASITSFDFIDYDAQRLSESLLSNSRVDRFKGGPQLAERLKDFRVEMLG